MYLRLPLLFMYLLISITSYAQMAPNTCSRSEETRVDACTNSKAAVWYYTVTDESSNKRRSWLYRTQAEAARARDNEKKLCQTVARSFDKRDCQKTFGDIYCAGCGPKTSSDSSPELADLVESGTRLLDQWTDTAQEFAADLLKQDSDGSGRGAGSVMNEYRDELRAAQARVERLQNLLTGVINSNESSLSRLADAIKDTERAIKSVQAKHRTLSSVAIRQAKTKGEIAMQNGFSVVNSSVEIIRNGNRLTVTNPSNFGSQPDDFAIEAVIEGDRLTGVIRNVKIGFSEAIKSARLELELKHDQWTSFWVASGKLYEGRLILSNGDIRDGFKFVLSN